MSAPALVLSCEHASNAVPARLRALFRGAEAALAGHRGWDPGALELARELARRFHAPLVAGRWTRLLVDLNRSPGHPRLLSEWSRALPRAEREVLVARRHAPHRREVERLCAERLRGGGRVVHLSVHSFTQVLDGARREVDVGLLYDPARPAESVFGARWRDALAARRPDLCVRRNAPYRGTSDGLVTVLRRRLPRRYLGLELEVSQRFPLGPEREWRELRRVIGDSLATTLLDSRVA